MCVRRCGPVVWAVFSLPPVGLVFYTVRVFSPCVGCYCVSCFGLQFERNNFVRTRMKPYRLWSLICEAVYQLRYQLRWKQSMARNPDALSGLDLRRQRDQELMRRVDQQARAVAAQAETELCASIMAHLHIADEAELRECITQLISGAQGREVQVVLLGQDPALIRQRYPPTTI